MNTLYEVPYTQFLLSKYLVGRKLEYKGQINSF